MRLDPNDAHAFSFLGNALQRQSPMADAMAAFKRASSLEPLRLRSVCALVRLHARAASHYGERAAALNQPDPPVGRQAADQR